MVKNQSALGGSSLVGSIVDSLHVLIHTTHTLSLSKKVDVDNQYGV